MGKGWSGLGKLRLGLYALLSVLSIGIIGFMTFENLSFLDAAYMSVATMTTVGYGDIVPQTIGGRVFTICFILAGFGTVYAVLTLLISMIIEGQLQNIVGLRGMERKVDKLRNHIIVCGAGRVGANIVASLQAENQAFVVVEKNSAILDKFRDKNVLYVVGDATLDEVLLKAGIKRAKGVITALSHDADNVYVTLTAKSLNPDLSIVARAERPEAEEKLRRAGATTVIFPSVMGGRQMVSAMTKPLIMDFVENLFYNQDLHMDIAEIKITASSELVGQTMASSRIKEWFDSIVIAIKRGDELITNPRATEIIAAGDVMIVVGHRDSLTELNQQANAAGTARGI